MKLDNLKFVTMLTVVIGIALSLVVEAITLLVYSVCLFVALAHNYPIILYVLYACWALSPILAYKAYRYLVKNKVI